MILHTIYKKITHREGPERYPKTFSDKIFSNQLHVIWVCFWWGMSFEEILKKIKRVMKSYGYQSAMVSMIFMTKENCITKEQFDIEYRITNDGEADTTATEERDDLSLGEDLETLIRRIRNGEITKEKNPYGGIAIQTHLLCLLDKEERRMLDRKDENFLKTFLAWDMADVDEEEWKKSEYKHLKFSYSLARRQTTFVEAEDEFEHEFEDEFHELLEEFESIRFLRCKKSLKYAFEAYDF